MVSYTFIFSAIDCAAPLLIPGTERSHSMQSYGSQITYNCINEDEKFADGSNVMTIECVKPGVWNNTPTTCNSTCNTKQL